MRRRKMNQEIRFTFSFTGSHANEIMEAFAAYFQDAALTSIWNRIFRNPMGLTVTILNLLHWIMSGLIRTMPFSEKHVHPCEKKPQNCKLLCRFTVLRLFLYR